VKTRITELRKAQGLTQQELADKTDVTRQTIIALEQGRYNPSLLLAHKIAKALSTQRIEDVFDLES
jgi:putative transcriptional regulator